VFGDPSAGGQLLEQRFVEPAWGAEVLAVPQPGRTQAGLEASGVAMGDLAIEQQRQPFGVREIAHLLLRLKLDERLEAACRRALEIGARSYSSVNSILKNNLDRRRPAMPADGPAITHDNIRGPTYFH
jgi:hypothetical protein